MNNCKSSHVRDALRRIPGRQAGHPGQAVGKRGTRGRASLPAAGVLLALVALLGGMLCASAQSYSINWYKVAGGSGTSTGSVYSVSGTMGQPDASAATTGGNYSLTGGFWSLLSVVQTPGAPLLTITHAGNQAIVSWPPSATGWTLQTNITLATATWGNYAGSVLNNSVTNSPPPGTLFFRLKQ